MLSAAILDSALWFRTTKNRNVSTGPLALSVHLLARTAHIRLLLTARFTCELCCAHSFNRSLTQAVVTQFESVACVSYPWQSRSRINDNEFMKSNLRSNCNFIIDYKKILMRVFMTSSITHSRYLTSVLFLSFFCLLSIFFLSFFLPSIFRLSSFLYSL